MQRLLRRPRLEKEILTCLKESPATVLLGARQTGKTTLAHLAAKRFKRVTIFDLERAAALRRFWTMLAHCHAQVWSTSEAARSMDVTPATARHYLDILSGAFTLRVLAPWHENVGKRQVKSPRVYLRDSGLLHFLLGIESIDQLRAHPRYGASWEGFALEQTPSANCLSEEDHAPHPAGIFGRQAVEIDSAGDLSPAVILAIPKHLLRPGCDCAIQEGRDPLPSDVIDVEARAL